MPDQSLLTILHVSDFHYSKKKWREQEIVIEALEADLSQLCIGHRRPDIIIFTGDMVNHGGSDSHAEAYDNFIARVSAATGCSDERIFIVPGNHDASQEFVETTLVEHGDWRDKSGLMSEINSLYDSGKFDEFVDIKFSNYYELEGYLADDTLVYRNPFVSLYRIDSRQIEIVVVNTAVLTSAGSKKLAKDEGVLAVPEYALRDAAKHFSDGSFRIIAGHHPTSFLSESSSKYLGNFIQEHADVHLFGHMHDPATDSISGYKGDVYRDQAGAIFTDRSKAYIGYSLLCLDVKQKLFETHLRSYFTDVRDAFDEGIDVIPGGRFYSSQAAREFWRSIATPVDEAAFRAHLGGSCLTALTGELTADGPGRQETHHMFVPPPLTRMQIQTAARDEARSIVETRVAFDDVVAGDDNLILYAASEYGRTTVLRELEYRCMSDAVTVRLPRLPIFIDFGDIKQNAGNLLRLIKSRAIGPTETFDVESLLTLGHVCILIDDVHFSDERRMIILREFVGRYPKARYILSSVNSSAAPYGAHVVPGMPIHFDFIELCILRRRDMRQLVTKYGAGQDVDVILDRLHSEISEINLPFTAANGSILMDIFQAQNAFRPINRAVLIEQFIDVTLSKAAVDQSKRETFDYVNKTSLLGYVAAWMARNNNYVADVETIRSVMKEYVTAFGLKVDLTILMDEFFKIRLFIRRPEDRLSFRYRSVLEYFISLHMFNDVAFKSWIMDEARYLSFPNEIQYYAGKLRNDLKLVDEIGVRFARLMSELEAEAGKIDVNQLANLRLPRKDGRTSVDELSRQLSFAPLTEEERDEELEAEIPRDAEARQEVFRPAINDLGQRLLVSIFLYSGALKNMELIPDADKRRHLANIWAGWAAFLHLSLGVVTELARHRRLRINGVLCELNAPMGISDEELAHNIALIMPTGVSKLISTTLGTEKLELQLESVAADDEPLVFEFFRASLVADLRLQRTVPAFLEAFERLSESAYLSEALIWKIADLRRMDRLSQERFDLIMAPLAEVIARLKGGTSQARGDEKRKQITRLKRETVLLRMKQLSERDEECPEAAGPFKRVGTAKAE